ncbi:MAG: hypothetical protein Q9164_005298 [Protoblastenia rupestris]
MSSHIVTVLPDDVEELKKIFELRRLRARSGWFEQRRQIADLKAVIWRDFSDEDELASLDGTALQVSGLTQSDRIERMLADSAGLGQLHKVTASLQQYCNDMCRKISRIAGHFETEKQRLLSEAAKAEEWKRTDCEAKYGANGREVRSLLDKNRKCKEEIFVNNLRIEVITSSKKMLKDAFNDDQVQLAALRAEIASLQEIKRNLEDNGACENEHEAPIKESNSS